MTRKNVNYADRETLHKERLLENQQSAYQSLQVLSIHMLKCLEHLHPHQIQLEVNTCINLYG
jgi:hypothetical protein